MSGKIMIECTTKPVITVAMYIARPCNCLTGSSICTISFAIKNMIPIGPNLESHAHLLMPEVAFSCPLGTSTTYHIVIATNFIVAASTALKTSDNTLVFSPIMLITIPYAKAAKTKPKMLIPSVDWTFTDCSTMAEVPFGLVTFAETTHVRTALKQAWTRLSGKRFLKYKIEGEILERTLSSTSTGPKSCLQRSIGSRYCNFRVAYPLHNGLAG